MRKFAAAMIGAALCGCAGSGERAEREPETPAVNESAWSEPGPVAPSAPVAASEETPEAFEHETSREEVKRGADDLLMRKDGRPSWWFADTALSGGRARVCSEALGASMLDAKRDAIEVARARLRKEMGLGPATTLDGETVERAWVWPLQHAETPGARYAGYVLVSVDYEK